MIVLAPKLVWATFGRVWLAVAALQPISYASEILFPILRRIKLVSVTSMTKKKTFYLFKKSAIRTSI
jgi:hypothetical protein